MLVVIDMVTAEFVLYLENVIVSLMAEIMHIN